MVLLSKSKSKQLPTKTTTTTNKSSLTNSTNNNNNISKFDPTITPPLLSNNSHQSPPPPPPSSSSLYKNNIIERGYLANSESSSSSSFRKKNNNNNMGNAQSTGDNHNITTATEQSSTTSFNNRFAKKSKPQQRSGASKKANDDDDDDYNDKESEVVRTQFDPSMMLPQGRRSSLYTADDDYGMMIPQQQSTGGGYNNTAFNFQQEYLPPPQQQSTGYSSSTTTTTFKQPLPPPSSSSPYVNNNRRSSVASTGSTGSLGYINEMVIPSKNDYGVVNEMKKTKSKPTPSTKPTPSKTKVSKIESTNEKKPSKKIQEIGLEKFEYDSDESLNEDDDDAEESARPQEYEKEKPKRDKKESYQWIDRHRSIPTFDTAFTTTRIYFKYDEYNLPAVISDQSNLIQIINEIKLKFKQLQNQDDSNIQISYDTNEIKNILVLDDESILEMIQYFKSIEPATSRIIKINLQTNNNQLNNNNLNNIDNNNQLNNNNSNIIICKFSAEYITQTLEKAFKNFVLKISYLEPLQKFINDVADKCSLPNGSGLYIIQFYDKAFNDYIDINDLNEMDLDKQGINLIKIKKSTRNNYNSSNSSSNSYSNAFIGLIINNKFIITESLGRGGQGCVFACQDLNSKKDYAIKFIISNGEVQQEQDAKKEAIFMERLQHPNIAKVEGVFTWNEILNNSPDLNYNMLFTPLLCILMERYFYGNIMQSIIIERGLKIGSLNLFLIFKIVFQTSKALSFIHDQQIIHRDIKPHNILIKSFNIENNDIEIVLSDFGTAKDNIHTTHHTHIGTLLFESPEVMLHRSYGLSADLYSLGVTLFQLLSLNTNFNATFKLIQNEKDCFNEMDELIFKNYQFYNFNQNEKEILNSLIEILHKLMKLSPQDRLTSKELVEQLDILELEYLNI